MDIDVVSEISNGVDSLIDPLENFFRQKLTLLKQNTDIKINRFDEEDMNPFKSSITLLKQ